ncbi:MAG: DUF4870 domain-containing protein [Myxococcales bacterium]|nr:DUF4870 domain-containing protein [Myxococcales bacterium]
MSHAMTFGEQASSDDKMWAMFAHLSSFVLPFFGSLLLYAMHKDKPYISYHAAQSLGFQVLLWVAGAVISVVTVVTCGVGSVLYFALVPAYFLPIWSAYVAYSGEWKGYPMISQLGK